jgi:Holliday junction resolvase RusA-like endonuclease
MSVFDALTGICYRDDSQVVGVEAYKRFADYPYTRIIVEVEG